VRASFLLVLLFIGSVIILFAHVDGQAESKNTESPLSYIEVGSTTPNCGNGGKTPYVRNRHPSRSIRVNLHVRYKYEGQERDEDLGDWRLMPGQTKKLTSRCTVPGPTRQRFTFYAHAAEWM
jgi:hypothetical protein